MFKRVSKTSRTVRWWLIAVIVMLTASGVSLAAWSDHLTVAAAVNTGRKDVVVSDVRIRADRHISAVINPVDDRTLRVDVANLYPGGRVWIDFKALNRGTIPVRFQSAVLTFTPADSPLLPYLRSWCWLSYDLDGDGVGMERRSYGYVQFPWGSLADLGTGMTNHGYLRSLIIAPNGWISFEAPTGAASETGDQVLAGEDEEVRCICIKLDENAPGTVENQTLSFTLQLNFIQWNG